MIHRGHQISLVHELEKDIVKCNNPHEIAKVWKHDHGQPQGTGTIQIQYYYYYF